jgi:hypothetical protein
MTFTRVVPALKLHYIRLEVESLTKPVLEFVFSAVVPVLSVAAVLPLHRRDSHHQELV